MRCVTVEDNFIIIKPPYYPVKSLMALYKVPIMTDSFWSTLYRSPYPEFSFYFVIVWEWPVTSKVPNCFRSSEHPQPVLNQRTLSLWFMYNNYEIVGPWVWKGRRAKLLAEVISLLSSYTTSSSSQFLAAALISLFFLHFRLSSSWEKIDSRRRRACNNREEEEEGVNCLQSREALKLYK